MSIYANARVTASEVIDIMDTSLTESEVVPFVVSANLVVTNALSGYGYSDDMLKEIEQYLAAHFAALKDPLISKENFGDAGATYEGKTGMHLDQTSYGQRVWLLDYKRILSNEGAEIKVIC